MKKDQEENWSQYLTQVQTKALKKMKKHSFKNSEKERKARLVWEFPL